VRVPVEGSIFLIELPTIESPKSSPSAEKERVEKRSGESPGDPIAVAFPVLESIVTNRWDIGSCPKRVRVLGSMASVLIDVKPREPGWLTGIASPVLVLNTKRRSSLPSIPYSTRFIVSKARFVMVPARGEYDLPRSWLDPVTLSMITNWSFMLSEPYI